MASTAPPRSGIADSDMPALMELVRGADTVELKLTVPESAHRSAIQSLGMDPLQAQIRQVWFLETPDLALDKAGLVVRARRSQGKGDDSVVKLRPVVPAELPRSVRKEPTFGVEVDASPKAFVCSGSMKGVPAAGSVLEAMSGRMPIRKLFSKAQRALFEQHAPEGVTLDSLHALGPLFVLKLKYTPEGFNRKLVGEMWLYPDGSRILELSTKCAPAEAFQVAGEARAFLAGRGIDLDSEQATKTRSALEFFSRPDS
jgi:hypothetical protein